MTISLVTGGAGFIGSHLVEALLAEGHTVRVVDNFATGKRENLVASIDKIKLYEISITDNAALQEAMEGVNYVFHQAAIPSVPRSVADPVTCHEVNVTGTFNVLNAARLAGVKRVVYAASSSAYGDIEGDYKQEDMSPRPLSPYGAAKLAGEYYMQVFYGVYGLETVCLRYFNVFGPRQDPKSEYAAVVPKFATAMLEGKS
ncbi:MAG: NAD-dependent epimerase/dehydratase family protein, partial [Anaerolineae bacterium]